MAETIGLRQLRNDNTGIMRRVEAGESFVVTRNGRPVADLRPHEDAAARPERPTLREAQELFARLPPLRLEHWHRARAADDMLFGSDDIDE